MSRGIGTAERTMSAVGGIRRTGVVAVLGIVGLLSAACGDTANNASRPTPTPTDTASPSPTPTATGATIQVMDNNYLPQTLTIPAGTPVVWIQTGVGTHTVTADGDAFDSHPNCPANVTACMKQSDTFVQTFDKAGRITYFCKVHKDFGMTGEIVVV